MKKIVISIAISLLIANCGGSSNSSDETLPTVSSVTDGNSATVATADTTGVYPNSFDIAFSEAMDDTSVTTSGNITFTCTLPDESLSQPTMSVVPASADYTYTVTVTDAYEYQLLDCVLTVTTNVTSAAEVALAEAATYTFTNACSVGDDFNADSSACWTVWAVEEEGELPPWPTWAALLDTSTGLLAFETSESTLIYSSNGKEADSGAFIYKAAVPNADGFSIIVKYTDLLTRGSGEDLDSLGFMLMQEDPATLEDPGKDGTYISMGLSTDNGEGNIPLCANTSSGSDPEYIGEVDCSSIDTLYMKLLFDGSTLTGSWSSDGDTYETISGDEGSWPTDFSGYNYLVILMETAEENPDTLFNIDHISTSGLTSTTQY